VTARMIRARYPSRCIRCGHNTMRGDTIKWDGAHVLECPDCRGKDRATYRADDDQDAHDRGLAAMEDAQGVNG
jgi:predicted  nucleic acid-binding Zn-ribbon protein